MFDKSDKFLLVAKKIVDVSSIVCMVLLFVATVVLSITLSLFCLLMSVAMLFCWLAWVGMRLLLAYMCDVKLIRNKLYELDNGSLKKLYEEDKKIKKVKEEEKEPELTPEQKEKQYERDEKIKLKRERMQGLLDAEIITHEEFVAEMDKYIADLNKSLK